MDFLPTLRKPHSNVCAYPLQGTVPTAEPSPAGLPPLSKRSSHDGTLYIEPLEGVSTPGVWELSTHLVDFITEPGFSMKPAVAGWRFSSRRAPYRHSRPRPAWSNYRV